METRNPEKTSLVFRIKRKGDKNVVENLARKMDRDLFLMVLGLLYLLSNLVREGLGGRAWIKKNEANAWLRERRIFGGRPFHASTANSF